jgi:hypothetical protein
MPLAVGNGSPEQPRGRWLRGDLTRASLTLSFLSARRPSRAVSLAELSAATDLRAAVLLDAEPRASLRIERARLGEPTQVVLAKLSRLAALMAQSLHDHHRFRVVERSPATGVVETERLLALGRFEAG